MKKNTTFGSKMGSAAFTLSLACLAILAIAQPSFAQPVSGQFADCSFDVTFDFLCSFPVNVMVTCVGKDIVIPGDRVTQIFPGEQAVVTNVTNGHSVTLTIPGTFHVTTLPNGTVVTRMTGRNLTFDPLAGFVLAIGNFSFAFDAAGNLIQPLAGTGQLVDVCALIQ